MLIHSLRQLIRRAAIVSVAFALATWTLQPVLVHAIEDPPTTEATETTATTVEDPPLEDDDNEVVPLDEATEPESEENTAEEAPITASSTLSEPLSQSTKENGATTDKTDTSLLNSLDSEATSGDATGEQNTTVGDISSGDAVAIATLINMLLADVQLAEGEDPLVFIYNVLGDVAGNLLIDPDALASGTPTTAALSSDPAELNSETTASIHNTLDLNAKSGNATAEQNTTAGNVMSGDAKVIVNVINLINSAISANQSFVGMINIFGNLDGDILVPYSFVEQLLAAQHQDDNPENHTSTITSDQNAKITNTVNADAQSGSATATDNSFPGSTTSGNTSTNITIFNLTNQQIIGSNVLLVFVNVLGSWVGLLLDAPSGTTSAALGGSNSSMQNNPSAINASTDLEITNDINVGARSGNATAAENTTVGDITSGESTAGVNLLNITNSSLSLANWFGVLFINVFGQWVGNFAVAPQENSSGSSDPKKSSDSKNSSGSNSSSSGGSGGNAVFNFVPDSPGGNTPLSNYVGSTGETTVSQSSPATASEKGSVKGSDVAETAGTTQLEVKSPDTQAQGMTWLLIGLFALGALLTVIYFSARRRQNDEAENSLRR